jgi:hypothetical protein
LLIALRSLIAGWAALFILTVVVERPIIRWIGAALGPNWIPTVQLIAACVGLFVTGWIIGRWGRLGVFLFAATIAVWNFGLVREIDIPWLGRLLIDCFGNSRYLESFFTSLATHVFLFGSLFAGATLSRARERTVLHIK